jgi:hypothetical protein
MVRIGHILDKQEGDKWLGDPGVCLTFGDHQSRILFNKAKQYSERLWRLPQDINDNLAVMKRENNGVLQNLALKIKNSIITPWALRFKLNTLNQTLHI